METNTRNYTLVDNEKKKQFELDIGERIGRIEYIKTKDKIYLTHTEVPPELKGKGIATSLVKQTLEWIEDNDFTLVPLCPFVAMYIKRHPEWKKLVLKGINIE